MLSFRFLGSPLSLYILLARSRSLRFLSRRSTMDTLGTKAGKTRLTSKEKLTDATDKKTDARRGRCFSTQAPSDPVRFSLSPGNLTVSTTDDRKCLGFTHARRGNSRICPLDATTRLSSKLDQVSSLSSLPPSPSSPLSLPDSHSPYTFPLRLGSSESTSHASILDRSPLRNSR